MSESNNSQENQEVSPAEEPKLCPHCGAVITGSENITGQDQCPVCKMAIDGSHLA